MSELNTYHITKKSAPTRKMSMEEIEMRLPELCADSPIAKYHLYATINDLDEEEKIEIDNTISALMLKQQIINNQYKEKCVIDANYDASGNLCDVSGCDKTINNVVVVNKYVKPQRKW